MDPRVAKLEALAEIFDGDPTKILGRPEGPVHRTGSPKPDLDIESGQKADLDREALKDRLIDDLERELTEEAVASNCDYLPSIPTAEVREALIIALRGNTMYDIYEIFYNIEEVYGEREPFGYLTPQERQRIIERIEPRGRVDQ